MTIVVTIVVLSAILHVYFEDIALKQTYTSTLTSLAQTSEEASIMAVNARTMAQQIYNDVTVSKLLYFSTVDSLDTGNAMAQLNSYRATSLFIDSIYLYNPKTDTFYSSSEISANSVWRSGEFYDTTAAEMVKHASDYDILMPIPRKIPFEGLMLSSQEKERECYSFLLYDTLSHNDEKPVIIVNISETQLHKNIDGTISSSDKNTFIIDHQGVLITNGWKYPMLTALAHKPYMQEVLGSEESEGYFVSDVDGVRSLVTYTAPDVLGWRYIRIAPYSVITGGLNHMRAYTIGIALAILVLGLLTSYLISRKLSSKVNHKLVKLTALETERRNHFLALRQDVVRDLLLGSGSSHPGGLNEKFQAYEIALDAQWPFAVVVLKIDRYKELVETYSAGDRSLLKIGIMNITQELLNPCCSSLAVDMGDDRIAILLNTPGPGSEAQARLSENLWRGIQSAVSAYIKVSVSIALSSASEDARGVSRLYAQATEALFHRVFYGYGCLIDAEQIEWLKKKQYVYPVSKEKQLIEELMLGRIAGSQRILREIVGETSGYSYSCYHLAVSHLAFAVNNAVSTIQRNNDISWNVNVNALLAELNETELAEQMYGMFFDVFGQVSASLEDKKNSRHDEVVGGIIAIIREKYMLQELSLESIAEEMNLSATHIGRLFKKHTSSTILNYIIEVRMDKARELLLTTDLPVGDTAEKTGFSNSPYFYKVFKKMNGVTPADFRKNGRLQDTAIQEIG
ncbi:helix-turn-helix domain-containing protein [Paenibacillus filicis]|uniref:Helix-turn-helix domain-containing protein n=1 Tax=Paenibacillus filicis TaxID=669464 RepID=A0ABU9DYJ0_9BACL